MLTGIELAGLLLAVIPILQTTAGGARSVTHHLTTAFSAKKGNDRLEDFLAGLHCELALLQMAMENFVCSLPDLNEQQRLQLRSGVSSSLRTDHSFEQAIKTRLGALYEPFQSYLSKVLHQLEKLVAEEKSMRLKENKGGQINAPIIFERLKELRRQRNEVAEVSDLKSRVHFTLKEGRLFRILDKITRYNQKLTSLLDMSDSHTSPTFTVDKQKQRSRPLPRVRLRPFVRDLYNCMGQLLPCDCEKSHETRLCLLECPDATNPDSTHVVLNMLMLIHGDVTSEHPRWLESRLHIHLDSELSQPVVPGVRFVLSEPPTVSTPPSSPDQPDPRALSGASLSLIKPQAQSFVQRPLIPSPPNSPGCGPRVRVDVLCKEMKMSRHPRYCSQMLFDGNHLWKMNPSQHTLLVEGSWPSKSLADLLDEHKNFTLRERRILAVILAHSLLHFCDSPWLSRNWNKHHLSFFFRGQGTQLDLQRPWVATGFEPFMPDDDVDRFQRIHPHPSILSLGILLLEIELQAAIESVRIDEDLSAESEVDCNTNFFTAERLLRKMSQDVFENYRRAIDNCLTCRFVEPGGLTNLDDDEFRQAVYENIVMPLENELESGFNLRPADLGLENTFQT